MDLDGRPIQRQPPLQDETRKVEAKPEPDNKWKRSRASYSFVGTARISGSRNARHAHACTRVTVGGPRPLVWSVGHPSDPQGPATIVTSGCARGMDHAAPRRPCRAGVRVDRSTDGASAPGRQRTRLAGTRRPVLPLVRELRPAAAAPAAGRHRPLLFPCELLLGGGVLHGRDPRQSRRHARAHLRHPPPISCGLLLPVYASATALASSSGCVTESESGVSSGNRRER